jgi:uroporphyrinogen decarboxylase
MKATPELRALARASLDKIRSRRASIERTDSKTRALSAIDHKPVDRVPIDLWASKEVKQDLEELFDMDYASMIDSLGIDFRVVHGPSYVGQEMESYPDGSFRDLWGVRRIEVEYGEGDKRGTYKEVIEAPLADAQSVQDIEQYTGWPSPDWWDYSQIAAQCQQFNGHCVIFAGDRFDRTAQLKTAMYLRGMERILLDLGKQPAIVECILEHVTDYYNEYNRRVFEAAAEHIDIFMMGDDFGIQTGPMMRQQTWEHFFEAGFREYIRLAHEFDLKVMHHTCGGVRPLIPTFIDSGLDILQSLQPRAAGMDLLELKRDFGTKLTFHGSIDIQGTMPFGTTDDVREEVRTRMEAGKPSGGFLICTAHNIQRDAPLENILALLEAYHEYGTYVPG